MIELVGKLGFGLINVKCIAELQAKAKWFEISGVIPTLWAGKGDLLPENEPLGKQTPSYLWGGGIPKEYWSDTYQWLPANVAFQSDGTMKFTSYINNLHPNKYPDIYLTIEKLIQTSLPAWDQCLALIVDRRDDVSAGRNESRFDLPYDDGQ
jgi:hypothetical protein